MVQNAYISQTFDVNEICSIQLFDKNSPKTRDTSMYELRFLKGH